MEITPIPKKKRLVGEVDVEMLESMVVSTSSCFLLIFWEENFIDFE